MFDLIMIIFFIIAIDIVIFVATVFTVICYLLSYSTVNSIQAKGQVVSDVMRILQRELISRQEYCYGFNTTFM